MYTGQNIKVFSDMQAVRKRPGMYIGSLETPVKLLDEILDNASDEALLDYASNVTVVIDDNYISVSDNGRGIPIDTKVVDKKKVSTPLLLVTKLHSGGKFDSRAYAVSSGLHGVGLVAVNALSTYFKVEIIRDTKDSKKLKNKRFYYVAEFENQKLKREEVKTISLDEANKLNFSTKVTFIPDDSVFNSVEIPKDYLIKRLKLMSAWNSNTEYHLTFKGEQIKFDITLNDLFKEILLEKVNPLFDNPIKIEVKDGIKQLTVFLNFTDDYKKQVLGVVNLLLTPNGTHINMVYNALGNVLEKLGKEFKIPVNKTDTWIGTRAMIFAFLPESILSFSSQTKEKLETSKTHFQKIMNQFEKQLENTLRKNKNITLDILAKIKAYRMKLKHRSVFKQKVRRGITSEDDILVDCTSDKGELFIVEGLSAAGSLKQGRDPKKHAILPLKGKSLNIANVSFDKLLKNKEFANLIRALGVSRQYESDPIDLKKLRYDKIIIACDADDDGKHIIVLILAFFLKYYKEIIEAGRLYIVEAPLFKIINGKDIYPAWSTQEAQDYFKKYPKAKVQRYKGLGEMNPNETKEFLLGKKRRLVQMTLEKTESFLSVAKLMTDAKEKFKLLYEVDIDML